MLSIKRILCPIDLSKLSCGSIELASSFGLAHRATVVFIYVAPYWQPDETMIDNHYIVDAVAVDRKEFLNLRPTDESVKFEHLFVHGNPGPEIIQAAQNCDMIVMSTHGHTGFVRLLVGSVAEYVMRHAPCPVITFKPPQVKKMKPAKKEPVKDVIPPFETSTTGAIMQSSNRPDSQNETRRPISGPHYVTTHMRHVAPIHSYQKMEDVIAELQQANQTGAPVVDEEGSCVGILTQADIERYRELQERFAARDESVIDEIFETDEFGQRRAGNCNFDLVCKHLTAPAVTVSNRDSCDVAKSKFDQHADIHHLVVVDEWHHPVGILKAQDLKERPLLENV